ncbi:glycosyltransferase family 4 protein [Brevundimonas mediterranea]|jgi:glycosyltransferase involved in cell wall biosynthesis|uniref:Alpha-D-kanosaminyltransferase n=1 Tax=Brevundimonas mediterranea TaxID=74329 RepID=A0A6G7EI13_9CAUL|nr:glycosyltransferase family 1 protein [Brevundimonas mediterranea]QIH72997.1 glycosyltransferase family 4 protein [Brevundimonas mediterranea]VDC49487.1 Alpha-D-kanosaminyltransferase [Brevundimonas mediterranea]
MKRICIDGYNLSLSRGTGIATYGRNLLINARELGYGTEVLYGPAAPRNRSNVLNEAALVDAERPPRKLSRKEKISRFKGALTSRFGRVAHSIQPSGEVIWPSRGGGRPAADRFWAAPELFAHASRSLQVYGATTPVVFEGSSEVPPPDVMHWTAPLPVYSKKTANIYTFHDLIPLRLPHTTLDDKSVFMALCENAIKRADHIAVVSETTRQDVMRILNVPEDRVTNTYQSVSLPKSLIERLERDVVMELEGIFDLGWKEYFLYFGAIEPKKNLGRIIEAYLSSGVKTPLIIIGGRAWLDEGETALLNQVKRDGGPNADRIRQYEFMSFPMLVSLIRGAKAVLFPSLYEGFGLPVLEAMRLSTAALTSTGGALPEVAGDAALIVDPYDVPSITRGIQALDADEALRTELVAKGLLQAARFTPEAYQQRLSELYAKVL